MAGVCRVAQRPKRCPHASCAWHAETLKAVAWQHLASRYSVYSYDVIAQIGWERQEQRQPFIEIHAGLSVRVPISGYVPRPLTVIGHFKLTQGLYNAKTLLFNTSTPTATSPSGASISTPTATATATPVAAMPITLAVASGNRAVVLDWNVTNDPGVTGYRILRAVGANGSFQPINDNWLDTIYFDTDNNGTNDLVPTTSYCY